MDLRGYLLGFSCGFAAGLCLGICAGWNEAKDRIKKRLTQLGETGDISIQDKSGQGILPEEFVERAFSKTKAKSKLTE